MAKMQKKNLNTSPDETRTFEKGKIELANFGDITIGRGILEPNESNMSSIRCGTILHIGVEAWHNEKSCGTILHIGVDT